MTIEITRSVKQCLHDIREYQRDLICRYRTLEVIENVNIIFKSLESKIKVLDDFKRVDIIISQFGTYVENFEFLLGTLQNEDRIFTSDKVMFTTPFYDDVDSGEILMKMESDLSAIASLMDMVLDNLLYRCDGAMMIRDRYRHFAGNAQETVRVMLNDFWSFHSIKGRSAIYDR